MTVPADEESALMEFLETIEEPLATQIRTLAHAWTGGGGHIKPGKIAIRLLGGDEAKPYTGGYLHVHPRPRLEVWRVMLLSHGLEESDWLYWSDEIADIQHGFDPTAKFPTVELDGGLDDAELVRLVVALRDLARLAHDRAA